MMGFYQRWAPYVPVAQRRANASREASKFAKKGQQLRPIHIKTQAIATSFWGLAWCKNLENYADWANRLPRGRTYARDGSIIHLQVESGSIKALVSGSSLYKIDISIDALDAKRWTAIRRDCASEVSSLLDLMRGKLPSGVLARLTDPKQGMFPIPKELKLNCSCPDYATMCKHVAATLYGVGHLLDTEPALFFKMRGVNQSDLVSDAMTTQSTEDSIGLSQQSELAGEDLSALFGIDLTTPQDVSPKVTQRQPAKTTKPAKSTQRAKPTKPSKLAASRAASDDAAIKLEPAKAMLAPATKAIDVKKTEKKTATRGTRRTTTKREPSAAMARVLEVLKKKALEKAAAAQQPASKKAHSNKAVTAKAATTKASTSKEKSKKKQTKKAKPTTASAKLATSTPRQKNAETGNLVPKATAKKSKRKVS